MHTQPDSELVKQARAGDQAAFDALFHRYRAMCDRLAGRMVDDSQLAADLAQEALLQAYLGIDRLRDPERFGSWLYGIVLNVCRNHLKFHRYQFFSLEQLYGGLRVPENAVIFGDVTPNPESVVEQRELHQRVLAAVESLSPTHREAVLLHYYDGLTTFEAAAILGISTGAFKVRLHRARESIRQMLRPSILSTDLQTEGVESTMIQVRVADVFVSDDQPLHVLLLLDEASRRVLPIWIGAFEGHSIAIELLNIELPRPNTFQLMHQLLTSLNVQVTSAAVHTLESEVFYGRIEILVNGETQSIDARPSDAIALALLAKCPIYVSETLMTGQGRELPPDFDTTKLRQGLDYIKAQFEQKHEPGKAAFDPETLEDARSKLWEAILGE